MMQAFYATLGVLLALFLVVTVLSVTGALHFLINRAVWHFKYGRMFK